MHVDYVGTHLVASIKWHIGYLHFFMCVDYVGTCLVASIKWHIGYLLDKDL
jgi:hypothetical protein